MGICHSQNNSKISKNNYYNNHRDNRTNFFKSPMELSIYNLIKSINYTEPIDILKPQINNLILVLNRYNKPVSSNIGNQPIFSFIIIEIFNQFLRKNQIFTSQLTFIINSLALNDTLITHPLNSSVIYVYSDKVSFIYSNFKNNCVPFKILILPDLFFLLSTKFKHLKLTKDFSSKLFQARSYYNKLKTTDYLNISGYKPTQINQTISPSAPPAYSSNSITL